MAKVTPNLGLKLWNLPTDRYNSQELAENFAKLDQHNHTPGQGEPIGVNGLADGAVTTTKLQDGSVTAPKLADGAIDGSKLGAGQIGTANFQPNSITEGLLESSVIPVGTVVNWWRPSVGYPLPNNWVVCDGRTITDHSFGTGSIVLPDLRNHFVLGADPNRADGSVAPANDQITPPGIRGVGGSSYRSFNHTHSIGGDGNHSHQHIYPFTDDLSFIGPNADFLDYRGNVSAGPTTTKAVVRYVLGNRISSNVQSSRYIVTSTIAGSHTHGGTTGSALGSQDIKPAYVGLLFIIKVKHG